MERRSHGAPGGDRAPCATTLACLLSVSPAVAADLPLGKWNTIDDKTGKVKSDDNIGGVSDPNAIRAPPLIWKRPKRLVGRQGLEPWTR
jgi:hypothetical protein